MKYVQYTKEEKGGGGKKKRREDKSAKMNIMHHD